MLKRGWCACVAGAGDCCLDDGCAMSSLLSNMLEEWRWRYLLRTVTVLRFIFGKAENPSRGGRRRDTRRAGVGVGFTFFCFPCSRSWLDGKSFSPDNSLLLRYFPPQQWKWIIFAFALLLVFSDRNLRILRRKHLEHAHRASPVRYGKIDNERFMEKDQWVGASTCFLFSVLFRSAVFFFRFFFGSHSITIFLLSIFLGANVKC